MPARFNERMIMMENKLWSVLSELKSPAYDWVDLSHKLNNDSPFWGGIPKDAVELCHTVFDWGNPMLECLIQTFKFPGQFGTHMDFPGHFKRGAVNSDAFGVKNMLYPLVVVDISDKVKKDVHYAVTVDDIKAHEEKYGPIPAGAFVALRTDWAKNWPDGQKMAGLADDGSEHAPGWSLAALKYIYETRQAAANGHETLDTDATQVAADAGDLVCERYVLSTGHVQIEALDNLDKVAPTGALLFAAWPNIEGATGLPVRVLAITPKASNGR